MKAACRSVVLLWAACAMVSACGAPAEPPVPKLVADAGWARWPAGFDPGEVSAVDVRADGHVLVLHRPGRDWAEPFPGAPIAAPVVAEFDAAGKLVAQWGAGETVMPHGLSLGPDGTVWITDAQREQLLHFTPEGSLMGTFGERGMSGDDDRHFGRPTDVSATARGVAVADGYRNSRILRLGPGGTPPVTAWGGAGEGPGGLQVPHSVDSRGGLLLVADREHSRLKIYSATGHVDEIVSVPGKPYAAKWLPDGRILSLEGRDAADREGAVLRLWTAAGKQLAARDIAPPQERTRGHDLAIAPDGTIYVADVAGHRLLVTHLAELTGQP